MHVVRGIIPDGFYIQINFGIIDEIICTITDGYKRQWPYTVKIVLSFSQNHFVAATTQVLSSEQKFFLEFTK